LRQPCPTIAAANAASPETQHLVARLGTVANPAASEQLMRDIVLEGNRLSDDADDRAKGAQTLKDLVALDEALSRKRGATWAEFAPEKQIHLRLTASKLFVNLGCSKEAAANLEGSLQTASGRAGVRAQVLTNLGAIYAAMDDLPRASDRLSQVLTFVPNSVDYQTAKLRLGALDASARLARKRGDRQKAAEFYRRATAELNDPKVNGYFGQDRQEEFESLKAVILVNRAILMGYEERNEEATRVFEEAYRLIASKPNAVALQLNELLIAWSDNRLDQGDREGAIKYLDEAIKLLQSKGGRPEVLQRALQKRAAIAMHDRNDRLADDLVRQAESIDRGRLAPLDQAKLASTKGSLLAGAGRHRDALPVFEEALRLSQSGAPEGTYDVAKAHVELALAKGHVGDLAGALEEARAADQALTAWLAGESTGCRAGVAANRENVAAIREVRGLFAILRRQELKRQGGAIERELNQIDRDIFDLVQERERDRVGVAFDRSILRRSNADTLRKYQNALKELCEARAAFDDAVQTTGSDLSQSGTRLVRARAAMAESERVLHQDVRLRFATGTLRLVMEDLPSLLQDREAIVAFRIGGQFTLIFIAARHGDAVVTATALSQTAKRAAVASAVSAVLDARGKRSTFPGTIKQLGKVLGLGELKSMLDDVDHAFVVGDGDLQRLPAHLLPFGSAPLGDLASVSTLTSLSMLAALRNPSDRKPPLRSATGFGAPVLDQAKCPGNGKGSPRELVQCLGEAYGANALLRAAHSRFGGAAPVTGEAATVAALRKVDFSKTGVLVLATHGLIGDDAISKLPAIVLTPDPANPADAGLFTTTDIAGLDLDSVWLAVIAACRTAGAAPDAQEEGLSGLGLAFATAGAKALILSYWEAEASATQRLLEKALSLISSGANMSLSAALATAMGELRKDGYTPEQWAPFVIIGDGAMRPFK